MQAYEITFVDSCMCSACLMFVRKRGMAEDEVKRLYGVEGIHCGDCK